MNNGKYPIKDKTYLTHIKTSPHKKAPKVIGGFKNIVLIKLVCS